MDRVAGGTGLVLGRIFLCPVRRLLASAPTEPGFSFLKEVCMPFPDLGPWYDQSMD